LIASGGGGPLQNLQRITIQVIAAGMFVPARCTISRHACLAPTQEGRMSKFAIRLLTLAMYATALALVPMGTPAKAETSGSKHLKKHKRQNSHKRQRSLGFGHPRSAGQPWPVTRPASQTGAVCPGIGRSFDCRVWPPPFDDDPDRKVSGRH
jgi:hypothetical protein